MEVGEEREPLAKPAVLARDRLLDLEQQLARGPHLLDRRDPRAHALVGRVGERAPGPGAVFDRRPRGRCWISSSAPGGRQRDAVLVRLDLLRDADPHGGGRYSRRDSGRAVPRRAHASRLNENAGCAASACVSSLRRERRHLRPPPSPASRRPGSGRRSASRSARGVPHRQDAVEHRVAVPVEPHRADTDRGLAGRPRAVEGRAREVDRQHARAAPREVGVADRARRPAVGVDVLLRRRADATASGCGRA